MTPAETKRIVARVRASVGLSRKEFAALLGVHLSTVYRWEAGQAPIIGLPARVVRMLDVERRPHAWSPSALSFLTELQRYG